MNANDAPFYILSIAAARARFDAGCAVTMTRTGESNRAEGWEYATARYWTNPATGVSGPEWKAPGAKAWKAVTGDETGPHAKPLRMLLSLMLVTDETLPPVKMTDREMATAGLLLMRSVACVSCGKELTTPDSIREGAGPECGIRAKARAEKRAAKDAAMAAFSTLAAHGARPK